MIQTTKFGRKDRIVAAAIAIVNFQNPFHRIAREALELDLPYDLRLKEVKRLVFWGTIEEIADALIDRKNAIVNRNGAYEIQEILAKGLKRKIETEQKKLKRKLHTSYGPAFESCHADSILFEANARKIKLMLCGNDDLLGVEFGARLPKPILSESAIAIIESIDIKPIKPLITN